jgi:aspartate racemase
MRELSLRKLGLIGGMSWVSTSTYYTHLNRIVQNRVSKYSSAPLLIESLDFAGLYGSLSRDDWDRASEVLVASAKRLETAGAGALAIGANSMHKLVDRIEQEISIPIIHIADAVGARMKEKGIKRAALLGSRNVMTESFYRQRLVAHGVDLLPPSMEYVEALDKIIYEELVTGRASRSAQRLLKTIITNKEKEGAQGIVLGCTELEMVVDVDANVLPIFDSTRIHADRCAAWILGED